MYHQESVHCQWN